MLYSSLANSLLMGVLLFLTICVVVTSYSAWKTAFPSAKAWTSIKVTYDGSMVFATASGSGVWRSTSYGEIYSWSQVLSGTSNYKDVAISSWNICVCSSECVHNFSKCEFWGKWDVFSQLFSIGRLELHCHKQLRSICICSN